MKKRIQIFLLLLLAWALACLVLLRISTEGATVTPYETEAPVTRTSGTDDYTPEIPEETLDQEIIAWQTAVEEIPLILESVPLDRKTQWRIYELCGQDNSLYAAVMAIAAQKSQFDPNAIGDEGRCIGMMQINYSAHRDRIKRLGITDLLDPVQNTAVAIDYIKDLLREFGVSEDSHILHVAYDRGPAGARELFNSGIYSTIYSWDVTALYQKYLTELDARG